MPAWDVVSAHLARTRFELDGDRGLTPSSGGEPSSTSCRMPSRARRRARGTPSSSSERPGSGNPACSMSSTSVWATGRHGSRDAAVLRTRHAVPSVDRSVQAALRDRRVGSGRRDHRQDRGRGLAFGDDLAADHSVSPVAPRRGPGRSRRGADESPAPPGRDRGRGRPADRRRGADSSPGDPHRGSALDRQRLRGLLVTLADAVPPCPFSSSSPTGRGTATRSASGRFTFGSRRRHSPQDTARIAEGVLATLTAARGDRRDLWLARARGTRSTSKRSSDRSGSPAPFARRQTAT